MRNNHVAITKIAVLFVLFRMRDNEKALKLTALIIPS